MNKKINITIYNEYVPEREDERAAKVYPEGIHTVIRNKLSEIGDYNFTIANFDMPEHGLTDEVLKNTDVLIYWAHWRHGEFSDEIALRIKERVLDGMGFVALHSAHASKAFKLLMGTSCRLKWRNNKERQRIWTVESSHPIAKNIPEHILLDAEETYGERFEIPAPDELVFMSWFQGGEVFRSGCCYKRGLGKIFYFSPGDEEYPTYYRDDIIRIIANAIDWACPCDIAKPTLGYVLPLEDVEDANPDQDEATKMHAHIK